MDMIAKREDVNPKEGENKYGDVQFADPKNKKYPIDTVEHIRAAWNYCNKAQNAKQYSDADMKAIKERIIAAWKSKIHKNGPPSAEKMSAAERVFDAYVATRPGEAYRLLPFGRIQRAGGGKAREFTPEMAAKFHLPHFKPPVKLGSHEDTTPAGGHIVGLEVRVDGLYAIPEMTEKGSKALADGDFKYHSPEIIWEDGAIEDATTGSWINGPLIMGDALLHVPALGEATALYTSQIIKGEDMSDETVKVPKTLWDNLKAAMFPAGAATQQPVEPVVTNVIPEEYSAAMQERDQLKAKLLQIEADKAHSEAVSKLSAALLSTEKYGAEFAGAAAGDAAEVLAGMTQEQREWVMTRMSAMAKRIDYSAITSEIGTNGTNEISDPRQAMAAAIESKMKSAKVNYEVAYQLVKDESPDLFAAYAAAKE